MCHDIQDIKAKYADFFKVGYEKSDIQEFDIETYKKDIQLLMLHVKNVQ